MGLYGWFVGMVYGVNVVCDFIVCVCCEWWLQGVYDICYMILYYSKFIGSLQGIFMIL